MNGVAPERWRVMSPLLERALELSTGERAAWLASLRAEDPALAAELTALLEEGSAVSSERFLEGFGPPLAALASPAALADQIVGSYTLVAPIGHGGMGSVWLARRSDGRFEGLAAVKLLNAELVGGAGAERFQREGNILARLTHSNIAHLIDAGVSADGQPYLVLEHVEGEHIDGYCDGRGLDIEARLRLFLDVLAAVAHAHANLIVHRDIKPSNVLVSTGGQVKLLDFGIAKLLEGEGTAGAATALTREAGRAFTPEYAAPEQVTGGQVTTATDVYALGVLLYVLLGGRHPAGAALRSPAELLNAIVDAEPQRLSDAVTDARTRPAETLADSAAKRATTPERLRRLVQGDLDTIVAKTLKKRPEERYQAVTALADDLRRCLDHQPISARPDTLAYRTAKFVRRNRTPVALATLAVIALIAGLVGTVTQARRATREAAGAQEQRDFALRQLSRAEAINDLNNFVLSDSPTLGRQFTVGELLARAENSVDRQQGVASENRVELLLSIGYQYQSLDQHDKGRAVLTRAYQLAGQSADTATRAKAACALASAIGQAGEGEPAEQLLRSAENELPAEPQFALHRVFCLEMGSVVAQERGDADAAVQRAEAAQRLLKESRFDSAFMDLRIAAGLAAAYQFAGRLQEAVASYEQAYGGLAALGREETRTAGTILNNWGSALLPLGRPLEAERLFRRVIETGGATAESATPVRLINLARALRDLQRLSEAAHYVELAYSKSRQLGHEVGIDQSLFVRATIYRQQAQLERATQMLAELEPRLKRMPPGHIWFGVLASERAPLAQARGDSAAAMAEADRAVAIAEASTQRSAYLARFLLRRSEVAFQVPRLERAAADAETAIRLELEVSAPGTSSSNLGHCYLALGRALQAQGRASEAQTAFTAALEHLEPTLGADHAVTLEAMRLALETRLR